MSSTTWLVGISVGNATPASAIHAADYLEIKRITIEEVSAVRGISRKPLFFHLQYLRDGAYLLPTAFSFKTHMKDFHDAWDLARPRHVSLHFGLAAPGITLDPDTYMAVALEPPLPRDTLVDTLYENLSLIKKGFPQSAILLENLEFVPEALSKGAYRYVQEAHFFSEHVARWRDAELIDGIVFDVAHGLIAAGNHPLYNGLAETSPVRMKWADPIQTSGEYVKALKRLKPEDLLLYYTNYINQMPLEQVHEIHISGVLRTEQGVWVDAHNEVSELELEALRILLHHDSLRGRKGIPITLEYVRKPDLIVPQLEMIRDFLSRL